VREAKANEQAFQARVRTVLRGSYSNHYRRMLPPLLAALEFGCHNNTAYRPVMAALALLARYAGVDGKTRLFAESDTVPAVSSSGVNGLGRIAIHLRSSASMCVGPRLSQIACTAATASTAANRCPAARSRSRPSRPGVWPTHCR
jgi:hypothetical protein